MTDERVAVRTRDSPQPIQDDQFSTVFERISALRGIAAEDLILCYRNRQVFPFGTPRSLRIFVSADLKGYTRELWDKLEQRRERAVSPQKQDADDADELVVNDSAPGDDATEDIATGDTGTSISGMLRVTVRGSQTQSLGLAVKPSTLVSQLLSRYCRKFSVPSEQAIRMWLEFDGEQLDSSKRLEDYDEIEDEDTIDVRAPKVT
jgi:hypothetical protein